jgi:hypothetical protein
VVGKLLTQGLIEEIPARGALAIWRLDEENGALAPRIIRRGLAAIRNEFAQAHDHHHIDQGGHGEMASAMDYPVSHDAQMICCEHLFEPLQQDEERRLMRFYLGEICVDQYAPLACRRLGKRAARPIPSTAPSQSGVPPMASSIPV